VRLERLALEGDPDELAARVRGFAPGAESVEEPVRDVLSAVRERGDDAVLELTRRFDTGGAQPWPLRVDPLELETALSDLDAGVREALELAAANVRAVALAGLGSDREVELPQGQRVVLRELPVRRAAVYVPGGRAPYPSTVVMGAVTARAAGVEEVVVCAPPGGDAEGGWPVILAACALSGVDEVYRMGGAQAIAALAYGTETVPRVDVVVGPGNLYVQEAKRQLAAVVGIDGFAGPSDLLVLLSDGADTRLAALDLLAQAEHGPESVVAAVTAEPDLLDALATELEALAPERPTADPAACALIAAPDTEAALAFAEAFAPEHLQLAGAAAEALAPRVRAAGCLFVGVPSGTAFGDYVAGSNHVLPTGGAARFGSALAPGHFRRRMAQVQVGADAAALAGAGAAIARAEGFVVHAESMEERVRDNGADG
jgi:histidinol dehydrogenase